jgi:hypothetical protein
LGSKTKGRKMMKTRTLKELDDQTLEDLYNAVCMEISERVQRDYEQDVRQRVVADVQDIGLRAIKKTVSDFVKKHMH